MTNSNQIPALSTEYDYEEGTYRVEYDETDWKPSTVVVLAIADVKDTDALEMDQLNDSIDPDCLDALFVPKQDGTPRSGGRVTFPFAGHEVTVYSEGAVVLDPR